MSRRIISEVWISISPSENPKEAFVGEIIGLVSLAFLNFFFKHFIESAFIRRKFPK